MAFSFGNTQAQPTLGFGTPTGKTGFGTGFAFGSGTPTVTTTTTSTFSGFGSTFTGTPASTTSAAGFGTPTTATSLGFGTPAASSASAGFGTSFITNTAPTFGSAFGTPALTSTTGGFGTFSSPAATTTNLFSGFNATNANNFTGFTGFAAPTTTPSAFSSFGNAFNTRPTQSVAFPGFNSGNFGQPAVQQPTVPDVNQVIYNSIFNCNVYGDERDALLAKWNLLQASWGTGRGYYNQSQPAAEYSPQNPYCRFKAIGYSVIPDHDNKEGLTAIVFSKKESDVKSQKDQLIAGLNSVLGNKANLTLSIHSIRSIAEQKTQVLIYVQEKGMTGSLRKIPAIDLANFLLQPMQKQQLVSLGVENVFAHVKSDTDQLKEYLAKAPTGVDIRIWKQAQIDNPNATKYIPIPLIGFEQLKWRSKCQEKETALHRGFLEQVSKDIIELKRRHATSVAHITEQKRKLLELQHRVLQILARQEVTRKAGIALQPEEELLKGQLQNMQTQISVPTQFKGRLNELLAQIRILNQNGQVSTSERYNMDSVIQEDIINFLRMEQHGITHLVDIITTDLSHLKMIREGMQELLQKQ
ncbi:Nucleoporin 54kD [Carabus blaptoides fortunei]